MRLHNAESVTEAEIDNPVRLQHPLDLGHDRVYIRHMLVDVVEHRDVDGAIRQRHLVARRANELHMLAEPLPGLRQPRLVDIEPDDARPGKAEFIRYESGRTADVQNLKADEIGPAEEMPENGQHLSRLAPSALLVAHLGLQFGVGKLQRLQLCTGRATTLLRFVTGQMLHSTGQGWRPALSPPRRSYQDAGYGVVMSADGAFRTMDRWRAARMPRLCAMVSHPVFVTRKFPPSVGGMETLAAGVWRSLRTVRPDSVKISHGGSNRELIWWVPSCLVRLTWLCLAGKAEYVLCGDALMNALCTPVLKIFRVPQATMIMGLDVTYDNAFYRALVHPALRRSTRVIAISAATASKAIEIGVPEERIAVLRLGVEVPPAGLPGRAMAAAGIRRRLCLADDAAILLTLGRLVRRKGARWFAESVLPQLDPHVHYVIAGQGPEEALIRAAAESVGVADRVHLLGRVTDDTREELMAGADVFLAPNVPVAGDMEGFGLVTVEAAMRGTLVVAADLEGIKDAVAPGRTGILLPAGDVTAWVSELTGLLSDREKLAGTGDRFRADTQELYSLQAMGRALSASLGLGYAEPSATPEGR